MPNATSGFTGDEIVERVITYIGNTSTQFKTYIQNTLPLAEFRFCKSHDWQFLHKAGLSLSGITGTAEYDLSIANIGHYMAAADVESIFDETGSVMMRKMDLNQIRRFDPDNNDGSANDGPTLWAAVADNKIRIWPPTFDTRILTIDGKITPPALVNLNDFPTIPYRYQESFIEYVVSIALDRENDGRAPAKKAEALQLIRMDIQDDLRQLANTDNPRIRSMNESRFDGAGANVEALLLGFLGDFDYYNY